MKRRWFTVTLILVVALSFLTPLLAGAHTTAPQSAPSSVLNKYYSATQTWYTVGFKYANRLFGLLAIIEIVWMAITLALEGSELQQWVASVLKKLMVIGFFYALLVNANSWFPAIIQSFAMIGREAGGVTGLSLEPGDIMMTGITICGNMLSAAMPTPSGIAGTVAASLIPGMGLALTGASLLSILVVFLASLFVFLAYTIITICFIMAKIESYVALGAGVIFLGFGASRWTTPYVERYIALVVSTGVRLMILYMIIGLGQTLGTQWANDAQNLTLSTQGAMSCLGIAAGALTYMAVAWSVPKMVASVLGGSVSAGSSDLIGPMTAVAMGGATLAAAGATAGASLGAFAGASAAQSAGGAIAGTTSAASTVAATGGTGIPGGASTLMTDAARGTAVNPPSAASSAAAVDSGGTIIATPPDTSAGNAGGSVAPPDGAGSAGSGGPSGVGPATKGNQGSPAAPSDQPPSSDSGSSMAAPATEAPASSSSVTGSESPAPSTASGAPATETAEPQEGGNGNGGSFADALRMIRDEGSRLAEHAPQDQATATSATLNIHHGE